MQPLPVRSRDSCCAFFYSIFVSDFFQNSEPQSPQKLIQESFLPILRILKTLREYFRLILWCEYLTWGLEISPIRICHWILFFQIIWERDKFFNLLEIMVRACLSSTHRISLYFVPTNTESKRTQWRLSNIFEIRGCVFTNIFQTFSVSKLHSTGASIPGIVWNC